MRFTLLLLAAACAAPGTGSSGTQNASAPGPLTNGGFESGLTGWTTTGTVTASTPAHSGSAAAKIGASGVGTASSISQTFAAPAGAGALSFWYQGFCNDTVAYAWATATLKNNATGTTTTLLAKTCSNGAGYKQVTSAALTAGASYTLTVTTQSETYKTNYNYTLLDDVQIATSGGGSFALSLSPTSAAIAPGQSAVFTVATTGTGTIALSASGFPAGVSGTFASASISGGQSTTLTVAAAASAAGASGTFVVTGKSATQSQSATAGITVSGGTVTNDFSIAVAPASQSIAQGASATYTISSSTVSGSAQSVALAVSGLPSAIAGKLSASSITSGNSATLTLTASSSAAAAATTFTVTGTAASGSHAATASIAVTAGTGGGVGVGGGSVDHLYFAVIGDTRPSSVDQTSGYPTAIIDKIYQDIQAMNPRPQFVVSTGDYMYANTSTGTAQTQANLYETARKAYGGPEFPAMGNHECDGYTADNCSSLTQTDNIKAFMGTFMAPLGQSLPWYSIPITGTDGSWNAKLLVVACNYWNSAQQTWLTNQLATSTTYTILARHEPASANTGPCVKTVESLMSAHPYNLSLTGHTHEFAVSGKEVIVGNGGAPLASSANGVYGYGTVEKVAAGWQIKEYDYSTGLAVNTWTVP